MTTRARTRAGGAVDHVPRLPHAYVPRRRLWARLDEASDGALTLLVGPGGAGKTLGVSGWLRETGRAEDTTWLRADPSWTPDRLLPVLRGTARGRPRLVVVDDADELPIATVRVLDDLLDADPAGLRVLLISRWDLPLTRLAPELLGQFTVLRGELLRLDESEEAALVAGHVHTDAPAVARAIRSRTQGWCAAVVLAARAVAAAPEPLEVARRYADGDTSLADRVASEVFAALQPRQRHLLLCVATEPVVTPALAVHLSHDPRAREALAELEATGLLVSRLPSGSPGAGDADEEHTRYAIHPLLTEVVRRRTAAGGVDVLRATATVQRAVRLDVARGATDHAFRRLVSLGDHAGAAALLADEGPTLMLRGRSAGVNAFALEHPSAVDVNPASWFAIALERWFAGEIGGARHWLDRMTTDPLPRTGTTTLQLACVRLMRARLGLESIPAAVGHAKRVLAETPQQTGDALVAILLCELAITQNWLGDLDDAETNFAIVLQLSRSRELPELAAVALSHLAFTEYMQGREAACVEVADEVLSTLDGPPWRAGFSRGRAVLARQLALLSDVPYAGAVAEILAAPEPAEHAADLTTRFWARMRRSRLELAQGSLSAAERALDVPLETPELPDHLASALALERAFLASLAGDLSALAPLQVGLAALGSTGEAALAAGLRADLTGDRRSAVARFAEAAAQARYRQPAVRALALVTAAQLRDGLGDDDALELLREAAVETEVRRNAVPFLGWSRHGTRVADLLQRLAHGDPSPWVREVVAGLEGMPGIAAHFGPTTALPREVVDLPEGAITPTLSPRERDVLYELARGSTYADIAANLFVSENTVKTHVSSLYSKLAVNRRSAALAAARHMHLL